MALPHVTLKFGIILLIFWMCSKNCPQSVRKMNDLRNSTSLERKKEGMAAHYTGLDFHSWDGSNNLEEM